MDSPLPHSGRHYTPVTVTEADGTNRNFTLYVAVEPSSTVTLVGRELKRAVIVRFRSGQCRGYIVVVPAAGSVCECRCSICAIAILLCCRYGHGLLCFPTGRAEVSLVGATLKFELLLLLRDIATVTLLVGTDASFTVYVSVDPSVTVTLVCDSVMARSLSFIVTDTVADSVYHRLKM